MPKKLREREKEENYNQLMKTYNTTFCKIYPKQEKPKELKIGNYTHSIISEIIEQYEILIQLLVHQMTLCNDEKIKNQAFNIFQNIVSNKNKHEEYNHLPKYRLFLADFVTKNFIKEIWE